MGSTINILLIYVLTVVILILFYTPLLNSFDQSAIDGGLSIDRTSEAVQTTKLAVENLFNVIAENSVLIRTP